MQNAIPMHPQRALAALFFAVFATVLGVGMAIPLLPLHAHGLGATGFHIGILSGAFAFSRLVCAPWFGRHSDRNGRKQFIVAGLLLYALISISLGKIGDIRVLILARALHGVASAMLIPLMQAYVGDVAPHGREGRMMGMYGAVVLAGLGAGPMLGGFVNDHFGMSSAFVAMGTLAAAGAVLCALWLAPAEHEARARHGDRAAGWGTLLRHRSIAGLIVFRFCHVVCIGIVWSFLPLYMTTCGALSGTAAGMVVGLGVLASGLLNIPMGALADRADRRRLILVGGLIGAYGIVSLGTAEGLRAFAVASVCFGIGGGVAMPAAMAIVTRHGQQAAAMGTMMALMTAVHSAGMIAGAILGGLVMDHYALGAVFPVGTVIMLGGTLVFAASALVVHSRSAEMTTPAIPIPLH